jgi:methylamine utilization protein MauE/thioredoxin family protein
MPTVEAPLAIALGAMFLFAAAGKLARNGRFREALAGYRLARPAAVVAWLVPLAELAVGIGLVAGVAAAGWAAVGLLAVFSAALCLELATGSAPPACGCLMPGSGRPGPLSLVRNAALAAVALAVALGANVRLGEGFWLASYGLLWIAVAGLALLVFALYRQVGVLHMRVAPTGAFEHDAESIPLGGPAPAATAGSLVVFTSVSCPICAQLVHGLGALQSDHAVPVVHARDDDPVGSELHREFGIPGTPYAVYVDGEGLVRAKGAVNTLEQLEGLVLTGRNREREGMLGHV